MTYYLDSVTEKSWRFLTELKRKYHFVLIGGWAVWLYTQQLKSKDIDIVIDLPTLDALKSAYEIEKNHRLKKYQLRRGEVEVDIYVPFFSDPGVPSEQIIDRAAMFNGFNLPTVEMLIMLKLAAWRQRRASAKGRKDFLDIISLLRLGKLQPDRSRPGIMKDKMADVIKEFKQELLSTTEISELGINRHQISKHKDAWKAALTSII